MKILDIHLDGSDEKYVKEHGKVRGAQHLSLVKTTKLLVPIRVLELPK